MRHWDKLLASPNPRFFSTVMLGGVEVAARLAWVPFRDECGLMELSVDRAGEGAPSRYAMLSRIAPRSLR